MIKWIIIILLIGGIFALFKYFFEKRKRKQKLEATRKEFIENILSEREQIYNDLSETYKAEAKYIEEYNTALFNLEKKIDATVTIVKKVIDLNSNMLKDYEKLVSRISLIADLAADDDGSAAYYLKDFIDEDIKYHKAQLERYIANQQTQESVLTSNNDFAQELS